MCKLVMAPCTIHAAGLWLCGIGHEHPCGGSPKSVRLRLGGAGHSQLDGIGSLQRPTRRPRPARVETQVLGCFTKPPTCDNQMKLGAWPAAISILLSNLPERCKRTKQSSTCSQQEICAMPTVPRQSEPRKRCTTSVRRLGALRSAETSRTGLAALPAPGVPQPTKAVPSTDSWRA